VTGELRRPIRVAMLTSVHPPLDTRIFHREAKAVAAAGCDVIVIAPDAPEGPVDGVRFERIQSWGGRAGRPLRWPVLFAKAVRAKADIYHFHDPELLPWGLLLRLVTGRAVIYDSHEYLRESITTKYWIPEWLRGPAARFAASVERFVAKRISAVIVVTDDMGDRFRDVQENVVTVKNLPPMQTVPEPATREPIVVYAGLIDRDRGLDILWETAELVHARHPEARFEFYGPIEWHGLPDETVGRSAEEWASVGVRLVGRIPFDDVGPSIARGWIGWLPLNPREPNFHLAWPTKLVEYMAAGLAIVASDLPTQAGVIRESETGLVVGEFTAEAHADAICRLLEDEELRKRFQANGKEAARVRYTWETEGAKLQTLYSKLGAEKP